MTDIRARHKRNVIVSGSLSVLLLCLFVWGLLINGNGSVDRYNALIATDKAGGNVEESLRELRTYIYSHMNSEIGGPNGIYPPIQLSGTYGRLLKAEEARIEKVNSNLYADAQVYCERNGSQSFSGGGRTDCIDEYVDTNGVEVQPIDESLYTFNFVAPRWSFDLAGVSIVLFGLSTALTCFLALRYLYVKKLLK